MIIRLASPRQHPYVQVDRRAAHDPRLSLKARGLLLTLLAYPPDWEINVKHLMTTMPDGRDGLYGALHELRKNGYAEQVDIRRADGTFQGHDWKIFEWPGEQQPQAEQPDPEKPDPEKPDPENPPLTKKEREQKDPDLRARRGQSGTSPDPAILPETDDVPDVSEGCSVALPPAPPPLAGGAAEEQAPASVEEDVQLCGCGWPFVAIVTPPAEPPAPEQPAVSALPCAEAAARPEAPAEPLAARPREAAVPVPDTRFTAAPQGGAVRATRANGACAPAAPPECGVRYLAAWSDGPPEVGQARTVRGAAFFSPGFRQRLATRYGEECAHV